MQKVYLIQYQKRWSWLCNDTPFSANYYKLWEANAFQKIATIFEDDRREKEQEGVGR